MSDPRDESVPKEQSIQTTKGDLDSTLEEISDLHRKEQPDAPQKEQSDSSQKDEPEPTIKPDSGAEGQAEGQLKLRPKSEFQISTDDKHHLVTSTKERSHSKPKTFMELCDDIANQETILKYWISLLREWDPVEIKDGDYRVVLGGHLRLIHDKLFRLLSHRDCIESNNAFIAAQKENFVELVDIKRPMCLFAKNWFEEKGVTNVLIRTEKHHGISKERVLSVVFEATGSKPEMLGRWNELEPDKERTSGIDMHPSLLIWKRLTRNPDQGQ